MLKSSGTLRRIYSPGNIGAELSEGPAIFAKIMVEIIVDRTKIMLKLLEREREKERDEKKKLTEANEIDFTFFSSLFSFRKQNISLPVVMPQRIIVKKVRLSGRHRITWNFMCLNKKQWHPWKVILEK